MIKEPQIEDEAFWDEAVKDVKENKKPNTVPSKPSKRRVLKPQEHERTILYQNFHHTLDLDTTADIDKQTMRRFKKGEFGINATLDLHGQTQDEAYASVKQFIISSYLQNKRAVLIITGKGLPHKDEDMFTAHGVLKDLVPKWLKTDELSPLILSYIHPSAKLGGSGALYILLRRHRSV